MKKKKSKKAAASKQGLLTVIRSMFLILPLVLYLAVTDWLYPAPNSGFLVLGFVGCFLLGLGLVNIVGLLDNMYFGHAISAILLLLGVGLIAASSLIIYVPQFYARINEKYVSFYFIIWTMLLLSIIYYGFFRGAVSLYLEGRGLSRTHIKKGKKGKRNYWWYEELNKQISLSWIYYVNKTFTLLFLFAIAFQVCLGWWSLVFPITTTMTCLLLAIDIPMFYLIFTTRHLTQKERGEASHFAFLMGFILPIGACIGLISYYLKLQ